MTSDLRHHQRGTVILAAGGTGGHLFPAQALGETLRERGYIIHLMTDERGIEYGGKFPAVLRHEIEPVPGVALGDDARHGTQRIRRTHAPFR